MTIVPPVHAPRIIIPQNVHHGIIHKQRLIASSIRFLVMSVLMPIVLACPLAAGDAVDEGYSPSGDIHFVIRKVGDGNGVFLSPRDQPQKETELCDSPALLTVHFSPNGNWIVVEDGGASAGIDLRLFSKDGDVHFTERKSARIADKAEALAWLAHGLTPAKRLTDEQAPIQTGDHILDHRYVTFLEWSADSKDILIHLRGYSGRTHLNGWQGIYHIGTGAFSYDLGEMNRSEENFVP